MATNSIYGPLAGKHFRLLSLAIVDGKPCGSLENISLDDPPVYHAISYCWGDDKPTELFSCNGRNFFVSPHLYAALKQLPISIQPTTNYVSRILTSISINAQASPAIRVWIDAICIDQSNDAEKEMQVGQMGDIYRNALQVVAWLGIAISRPGNPGDASFEVEDSDLVIDDAPAMTRLLLAAPDGLMQRGGLAKFGLPDRNHRIRNAIGDFMCRPWFFRLWIVQEIVLAKEILLLGGTRSIDWKVLIKFTDELRRGGADLLLLASGDRGKDYNDKTGYTSMWYANFLRAVLRLEGSIPTAMLLRIARQRQVKEPVDKIYGFLGLVASPLNEAVPLDYSYKSKSEYGNYTYSLQKRILLPKKACDYCHLLHLSIY